MVISDIFWYINLFVPQTCCEKGLLKFSVEDIGGAHVETTYNDHGPCKARKIPKSNMTKLPEHYLTKMALSSNPGDRGTQLFIVMMVVLGLAWILV